MKKRCICAFICACILFSVCILPSSASENGVFRVAVIVDSDMLEGFASSEGVLRAFVEKIKENAASATFYFDTEDIVESEDLAAALIYLKVNGFRTGVFATDAYGAHKFNILIKYITKSASRLALCEESSAQSLIDSGYSAIYDFDLVFSENDKSDISFSAEGDTLVLFKLYDGSASDFEKLLEYALENGLELRAVTEKTE